MKDSRAWQVEYGDFQTPDRLAVEVCRRLRELGINPAIVVEPTCGLGSFVLAAARAFPQAMTILGFDLNVNYLDHLGARIEATPDRGRIILEPADFFSTNWTARLAHLQGEILVLGNLPWVTNSGQAAIGGANLPEKSNFLRHGGFDAISGKANFDISESMLLEVLRWFRSRQGSIGMLVKTAVARKVLAHAERQDASISEAMIFGIDAKRHFGVAVDACLLVMRMAGNSKRGKYDYSVFENLDGSAGRQIGHRMGLTVGNLQLFDSCAFLVGQSPQKWRSGVKHDATPVMEFIRTGEILRNNRGESIQLEPDFLYPLLKGSDLGANKPRQERFLLVTQKYVGESTEKVRDAAPLTWRYLEDHAQSLDARASIIYRNNPRFSMFGVGEYAFRPWRIAIPSLYKTLRFCLIGPIENRPVMFDDTVYYLSFDTEGEARDTLEKLNSKPALDLLSSLIFWDDKRPIKTSILNVLDWRRLDNPAPAQTSLL